MLLCTSRAPALQITHVGDNSSTSRGVPWSELKRCFRSSRLCRLTRVAARGAAAGAGDAICSGLAAAGVGAGDRAAATPDGEPAHAQTTRETSRVSHASNPGSLISAPLTCHGGRLADTADVVVEHRLELSGPPVVLVRVRPGAARVED